MQGRLARTWICKKCKESFDTSTKLRTHRKTHSQIENINVKYRPLEENDVRYNYRYDKDQNLFICNTCELEMLSQKEIEKHIEKHEDKFFCESCNEYFVKAYEFSCHMYKHDENKGFCCPLCKYETKRRPTILMHINLFHLNKYKYNCEKCGKGFTDRALYDEHDNVHKGIKPFECVVCLKSFVYSSYLYNHQVDNHEVLIKGVIGTNHCHICFKNFVRKRNLKRHMITHEQNAVKEKKHLCDICGKGFAQSQKLKIHYRVHTGDKPYICSYCTKSFTKKDYLIMHERIHSGEKPYACEYCGKCFNQAAPLRIHVRGHTGERPYTCHLCSNGFISRNVLNGHLKSCPGN